ncbi:MAG: beta-lactamase family protein [Acidobacteriia bacterium]|nr:beta-lactamase family protein [Terriglobia bacterium]
MKPKPLARLLITVSILTTCAFPQDRDARLRAAYQRLDAFVAREMHDQGIPGMSLALTDRNGLLYAKTYGYADTKLQKPVTPETEFEIGSISKSFTSISLLQLVEAGKFDPQQPITKYLPWFSIHSNYTPITAHDVMTHTAGLARDRDDIPSSLYQAAEVRDLWTGYEPGKYFAYSNIGYQIMGYMLEEITGKSSADNVRERLLQPLGMSHSEPVFTHDTYSRLATGYAPLYDDRPNRPSSPLIEAPWLEYGAGDGAIVSTASDMAIYLRMLLNHGVGPNGRIISEKSFDLLTQHGAEESKAVWYGYGMSTATADGHTYIAHDGGMVGYSSQLRGDMDNGVGVIALVNFPGGPGRIPGYALKLLRAVDESRDLPPLPEEEPPTRIKNAADFAGVYATPEGKKLTLAAEGESLLLNYGGGKIALEAWGKDAVLVPNPDFALFPLRFGREQGKVVEAFYGGEWYAGERYSGPRRFAYPHEWDSYAGHYRSNQAWFNNFRIVLRKGKLWLISAEGSEWAMTPDAQGGFWAGEEGEPPREQVRCDTVVHGKTLRCILSGQGYYRTFTP